MRKLLLRLLTFLRRRRRPDKIMYIGGSDTLPPPLPRDQEAELLARLDQGELPVRRPSSSGTCGWWSILPAGSRTLASTSRT